MTRIFRMSVRLGTPRHLAPMRRGRADTKRGSRSAPSHALTMRTAYELPTLRVAAEPLVFPFDSVLGFAAALSRPPRRGGGSPMSRPGFAFLSGFAFPAPF